MPYLSRLECLLITLTLPIRGGTSLVQYFRRVATYYNLEFKAVEWTAAEEPGTAKKATFYVTHLREPVDRAISHFQCK